MGAPPATIVVIDDEAVVRGLVGLVLAEEGYETFEAATAAEGVPLILEFKPDLILLDLNLPGQDPLRLVSDVVVAAGEASILGISGKPMTEDLAEACADWFDGFLQKPFEAGTLLEGVRAALGARGRPPPPEP